jgi:hypothetical protein
VVLVRRLVVELAVAVAVAKVRCFVRCEGGSGWCDSFEEFRSLAQWMTQCGMRAEKEGRGGCEGEGVE